MTVIEKIKSCVDNLNCEVDNADKIIALAYLIGKEIATREISDKYNELLREQRERAKNCRYHNMAKEIVGEKKYIYSPDYAMDMRAIFGSDETEV